VKARKVKGLDPERSLRFNAERIVAVRLEELRDYSREALEPGAEDAQHDMRIAAKRLRYALEIVEPCLGGSGPAGSVRKLAAELQGVLGDIHDCDVMAPRVEGSEELESLLSRRRDALHLRFRELWLSDRAQGTMARLESRLA
jgi:CHAD domain-containing protein